MRLHKITLVIFFGIIFSFQSCKNQNKGFISLDTEQAKRFCDLMNYLESKSDKGFKNKNTTTEVARQNYNANKQDTYLTRKIDSLLSLPVYRILDKISAAYIDNEKYTGRSAYREAFLHFPVESIRMNGGLSKRWAGFWGNTSDSILEPFLLYLSRHKEEVLNDALEKSKNLLPTELDTNIVTKVIVCCDGNRGSFQWGDKIIMELLDFKNIDTTLFVDRLSHEIHHRYYKRWLADNFLKKDKSDNQKALFEYQESFISEGIAQQLNFADYNTETKELYSNKGLISELYNEWILSLRNLEDAKSPIDMYQKIREQDNERRFLLVKKYCPDDTNPNIIAPKPQKNYYLSYYMYSEILAKEGTDKLRFVIENPSTLLSEYNKIYSTELLIPQIPDDIIKLWASNLE